jgi:hypothetical protein
MPNKGRQRGRPKSFRNCAAHLLGRRLRPTLDVDRQVSTTTLRRSESGNGKEGEREEVGGKATGCKEECGKAAGGEEDGGQTPCGEEECGKTAGGEEDRGQTRRGKEGRCS